MMSMCRENMYFIHRTFEKSATCSRSWSLATSVVLATATSIRTQSHDLLLVANFDSSYCGGGHVLTSREGGGAMCICNFVPVEVLINQAR